jgi:hypothetical protein
MVNAPWWSDHGGRCALQTVCEGGGMVNTAIIERMS